MDTMDQAETVCEGNFGESKEQGQSNCVTLWCHNQCQLPHNFRNVATRAIFSK